MTGLAAYQIRLSRFEAEQALRRAGLLISTTSGHADNDSLDAKVDIATRFSGFKKGNALLCYRGVSFDSHANIPAAENAGAAWIVGDRPLDSSPNGSKVPYLYVTNARAAWSVLASETYGNPQSRLTLVAVTGTNGKTSTVWLFRSLLKSCGISCATIGTLGGYIGDRHIPMGHTTPDPEVLFGFLADVVSSGTQFVAMEASSIGIAQEKLFPLRFAASAFTSFSRDHLDFHGTMEGYFTEKCRLFSELTLAEGRAFLCDSIGSWLDQLKLERLKAGSYGTNLRRRLAADVSLRQLATNVQETRIVIEDQAGSREGVVPLVGRHVLENFTAALLLAEAVTHRRISPECWESVTSVPGRLEMVEGSGREGGPFVFVDYAHTPDGLQKVLEVMRPLAKGDLWIVFGCGGDRDKGKRPEMGRIATTLADRVIVTSDNPRSEDPETIMNGIEGGVVSSEKFKVKRVTSRAEAIKYAINSAKRHDVIIVAGKGHETYQIFADKTIPFDDRVVAGEALENLRKR